MPFRRAASSLRIYYRTLLFISEVLRLGIQKSVHGLSKQEFEKQAVLIQLSFAPHVLSRFAESLSPAKPSYFFGGLNSNSTSPQNSTPISKKKR